jgi:hypothetical protein
MKFSEVRKQYSLADSGIVRGIKISPVKSIYNLSLQKKLKKTSVYS